MLLVPGGFPVFRSVQVWWPDRLDEVLALMNDFTPVWARACDERMTYALGPWSFRTKFSPTLAVDLSVSEAQLLGQMHQSCRYKVRRAARMNPVVRINDRMEEAFELI